MNVLCYFAVNNVGTNIRKPTLDLSLEVRIAKCIFLSRLHACGLLNHLQSKLIVQIVDQLGQCQ